MIYGQKNDIEKLQDRHKDKPDKLSKVLSLLQWVTDDRWFIREPMDGPIENAFIELLKVSPVLPDLNKFKHKTITHSVPIKQKDPPTKLPPSFFGKVASYWNAITGPLVDTPTYEKRLKMCTANGGYSYADVAGEVKEVEANHIVIEDKKIELPYDETPTVKKGDVVSLGQLIAKGNTDKPCPYLLKNDKGLFCNACGCGIRNKAELHTKLKYANLECPRTPPLFTSHTDSL